MNKTTVFLVPDADEAIVTKGTITTSRGQEKGEAFFAHVPGGMVLASWKEFTSHTGWAGFTDKHEAESFARKVRLRRFNKARTS